jgi:hypothetical protein
MINKARKEFIDFDTKKVDKLLIITGEIDIGKEIPKRKILLQELRDDLD